jgi:hypothetical protein
MEQGMRMVPVTLRDSIAMRESIGSGSRPSRPLVKSVEEFSVDFLRRIRTC